MTWAVGVDIGGTNVRVAQVTADGAVGSVLSQPVDSQRADGRSFAQLTEMIGALIELHPKRPVGIGIGATGPVDPERGLIINPHTLPPSFQGGVVAALSRIFELPVRLENDADAAALGEAWIGSAAGAEIAVCVTVGTGIGCGVVRHGTILRGAGGSHPEAGHHIVDPSGPECYCGARGCVESIASGTAIARAAIEAGVVNRCAHTGDVFAAAAQDTVCRAIVDRAHSALATAVINLVAIHGPDVVVLTGNGMGEPKSLTEEISRQLAAYVFTPPGSVRVCLSDLGGMAGCIGAARLVLQPGVWS